MVTAISSKTANPKPSSLSSIRNQNVKRPPLLPTEADNGPRRPKSKEVSSRYMSSLSTSSSSTSTASSISYTSSSSSSNNSVPSRRSQSPVIRRPATPAPASQNCLKRAQSAERRRPGTPDVGMMKTSLAAKLLTNSSRSLSVSFQGESFKTPVVSNAKAKPSPTPTPVEKIGVNGGLRRGTPERNCNVSGGLRRGTPERSGDLRRGTPERSGDLRRGTPERSGDLRRGTPERSADLRRGTPERRKMVDTVRDQRESLAKAPPSDQHRWPGRSRPVNSSFMSRSLDYGSDKVRFGGSGTNAVKALQKSMMIEAKTMAESSKLELKDDDNDSTNNSNSVSGSVISGDAAASDGDSVSSGSVSGVNENGSLNLTRGGPRGISVPARFWQETSSRLRREKEPGSPLSKNGLKSAPPSKLVGATKFLNDSPTSSPRGIMNSRGLSSPLRSGMRPASPSKAFVSSASSPSRGMASPTRTRNAIGNTLDYSTTFCNTPSILSFAVDVRRGKVGEDRFLDAHQLRLLYNRQLQWRFANARAEAAQVAQKKTAERNLYNAWVTITKLRHSVKSKRVELQQMRQNLKLYSILKEQMPYLENWDGTDRDHSGSLTGAIEALEASTIRLPLVSGARADVQNVKDAMSSAVDVMQAMASSICPLVTKVEEVNCLVVELANTSASERGSLDRCKDILSAITTLQVTDCSLRTHILQLHSTHAGLTT